MSGSQYTILCLNPQILVVREGASNALWGVEHNEGDDREKRTTYSSHTARGETYSRPFDDSHTSDLPLDTNLRKNNDVVLNKSIKKRSLIHIQMAAAGFPHRSRTRPMKWRVNYLLAQAITLFRALRHMKISRNTRQLRTLPLSGINLDDPAEWITLRLNVSTADPTGTSSLIVKKKVLDRSNIPSASTRIACYTPSHLRTLSFTQY